MKKIKQIKMCTELFTFMAALSQAILFLFRSVQLLWKFIKGNRNESDTGYTAANRMQHRIKTVS